MKRERDEDPQHRPITLVTHIEASPLNDKISELIDVLALNRYYGWYVDGGDLESAKGKLRLELEAWTKRCPGKPMMMTEYGTDTVAGLHDVEPIMFTEEYQVEFYKANHEIFDEFADFVGEQVWNFADFATGQELSGSKATRRGSSPGNASPKRRHRSCAGDGRLSRISGISRNNGSLIHTALGPPQCTPAIDAV